MKLKPICIFIFLVNTVFGVESSVQNEQLIKVVSDPVAVNNSANNLNSIDSSAENAIELKRQYEIAKQKAEIRKLQGTSSINASVAMPQDNAQTTVTGVAINQSGRKIAWLQFADGGTLTVDVGSKLGSYVVSNISMTGVTLTGLKNKQQKIFLKRAYSLNEAPKKQGNKTISPFPSPITTSANDDVPPIVSQ